MLLEDCDMLLGESLDTDGSLNGHVYDFRLWSRALATAEVAPGLKVRNNLHLFVQHTCGGRCWFPRDADLLTAINHQGESGFVNF